MELYKVPLWAVCATAAVVLATHSSTALAATITPPEHVKHVTRTTLFGGAPGDEFGAAVAINGDWAVVGAPEAWPGGNAYVYRRTNTGWAYHEALTSGQDGGDRFGESVAIMDGYILVGAPKGDGSVAGSGYAMLFTYIDASDDWLADRKLVPVASGIWPDADGYGDEFGAAVALGSSWAIVGCPLSDEVASGSGSVHTYWLNQADSVSDAKWVAPDLGTNSQFGASLDAVGDFFIAGAPLDDTSIVADAGTARLYECAFGFPNTWGQVAEFRSVDGHANDGFGEAVAISGMPYEPYASVMVGAPRYDVGAVADSGRAEVWRSNGGTWSWSQAMTLSPGSNGARLGETLSAEGAFAAVGMPGFGGTVGAVRVYACGTGTWELLKTLGRTTAGDTLYGYSVAVDSRGRGVTGCIFGDGIATDAGSAYFFTHLEPVYRFYNPGAGTHFFTPSYEEALNVQAKWPTVFTYEGITYDYNPDDNPQPLTRLYNRVSRSHFYTASPQEAANALATWPHVFQLDGLTYPVWLTPGVGRIAVYRFYNKRNGSHFYTASEDEKADVIAKYPTVYQLEGPAFWIGQ